MTELVLKDEVYEIIGAALEVYWQLGQGFAEPIYQEALQIEFARRAMPCKSQQELRIRYKEQLLDKKYMPDFICFDQIIVELKAEARLTGRDVAQLLNYMKMTRTKVGLLINFGSSPKLEWKRYVM